MKQKINDVQVRLHKWDDNQGNYATVLCITSKDFVREIELSDEMLGRLMMREAIETRCRTRRRPHVVAQANAKSDREKAKALLDKVWQTNTEDAEPANAKAVKAKKVTAQQATKKTGKAKTKKRKVKSSGTKGGDMFASIINKMGSKRK